MDTVTIKLTFPPVDGEVMLDPVTLTLAGRPVDELHEYAMTLVRSMRRSDWVAEVSRHAIV